MSKSAVGEYLVTKTLNPKPTPHNNKQGGVSHTMAFAILH
jgi:hypothetical protein